MNDLMLDLETFGVDPGCIVIQIGACIFDKNTGQIGEKFSYNIDARDSKKQGFFDDMDTVLWWMRQSKEAQNSVLDNAFTVKESLDAFVTFVSNKKIDRVWCHKGFDFPLLAAYYKKMDMAFPLRHQTFRDLHTILDFARMNIKNRNRKGIHHNGIDDCIFQVEYLVECLQIISKS
jgi:hypothetical protein